MSKIQCLKMLTSFLLIIVFVQGGESKWPSQDEYDLSLFCGVDKDCCEVCSPRKDCIFWLNCCDNVMNEMAMRIYHFDCVNIYNDILKLQLKQDVSGSDNVVMVVKCPNGSQCDSGEYVVGKMFTYISEACAVCNDDLDFKRVNITSYMIHPYTLGLLDIRFVLLIEQTNNKKAPIRHCNVHAAEKTGLICNDFVQNYGNVCDGYSKYFSNPKPNYLYCFTCGAYVAHNCRYDGRASSESPYSIILNRFQLAQLIQPKLSHYQPSKTDVACPKGHIISNLQTDCLPVSCPSLMLIAEDHCVEMGNSVKLNDFVVQLGLLPRSNMSPNLNMLSRKQRDLPFAWMQTPCSTMRWSAVGIYSLGKDFVNRYPRFEDSLLVRLRYSSSTPVLLNTLRHLLEQCLNEKWKMLIESKLYSFDVEIFPYSYTLNFDTSFLSSTIMKLRLKKVLYTKTDVTFRETSNPLYITKLFFCNQVRLKDTQVSRSGADITILDSNVTVGSSAYSFVLCHDDCSDPDMDSVVFVCLDAYRNIANKGILNRLSTLLSVLLILLCLTKLSKTI